MSRFRVLLIDDESELVFTLVERLKLRDIDASAVTRGAAALELMDTEKFDVIVLDVKMPEMSGVECMRRIKEKDSVTPVILLTGHGSREEREDGHDKGAFDYLMKPVKITDLISKMESAVASRGDG